MVNNFIDDEVTGTVDVELLALVIFPAGIDAVRELTSMATAGV